MDTDDPLYLALPPFLDYYNPDEVSRCCNELRSRAAAGSARDLFEAESECMEAWFTYGVLHDNSFTEARNCARRLLECAVCEPVTAGYAAKSVMDSAGWTDIALSLVEKGLANCDREKVPHERRATESTLLSIKLGILTSIDPDGRDAHETLEQLANLAAGWWVDYDTIVPAIQAMAKRGSLPPPASEILNRIWAKSAWHAKTSAYARRQKKELEQLIAITEPDPILLLAIEAVNNALAERNNLEQT